MIVAFAHCVHDPATAYGHHDVYLHPATDGGGGVGVPVEVSHTHTTHYKPRITHHAHAIWKMSRLTSPIPSLSLSSHFSRTIGSRFGGHGG